MRTLFVVLLCLAALPLRAHEGHEGQEAQEPTPQEMAQKKAEHMEKALKLDADQKAKVQKVLESSAAEMMELQKKLQKLERETHEKIRVLLTDEQKEKFDMMRAQMRMGGPGMMHGGPGMNPGGPQGGMMHDSMHGEMHPRPEGSPGSVQGEESEEHEPQEK